MVKFTRMALPDAAEKPHFKIDPSCLLFAISCHLQTIVP